MSNNSYYENKELWGRDNLTKLQKHVIAYVQNLCEGLPRGSKIADLGCGDGVLIKEIINNFPSLIGYGVDFSAEALKHVKEPLIGIQADLGKLPFEDDFFDLCFCIDVLEHIPPGKLQKVIDEIHRVCKGPVLLVSPYLESDAIQTICPYCNATFSPYYHVNRFTIGKWEGLVKNHSIEREYYFVPMGDIKSNIPYGIGSTMVASGFSAVHQHETICPQCEGKFRKESVDGAGNLTSLLSPYASKNKHFFGSIYEEMGIVTFPKDKGYQVKGDGTHIMLLGNSSDNDNVPAKLLIKSKYDIDFSEPDAILNGVDLFRGPAYFVNNGEVEILEEGKHKFLYWKINKTGNNTIPLRLVLPPNTRSEDIELSVKVTSNEIGTLSAFLYSIPPHSQIKVDEIRLDSPEEQSFNICIKQTDQYITPYGLLMDFIWESDSEGTTELKLYAIKDKQMETHSIPVQPNTDILIPEVTSNRKYLFMQEGFKNNKLIYKFEGRYFDMSIHLLDQQSNSREAIMLFKHLEYSNQNTDILFSLTEQLIETSAYSLQLANKNEEKNINN
ncbi:class I SAM-dependent methyltransferase, partial [Schinkia azotoformans]|uniref:class I SAM-dependent methyltransferase n=1 Tax=Schinkia azotoformans TaxID=1454 RepID=UPI0030C9B918